MDSTTQCIVSGYNQYSRFDDNGDDVAPTAAVVTRVNRSDGYNWTFDGLVVAEDGRIFRYTDSGCSCDSAFSRVYSFADLDEVTRPGQVTGNHELAQAAAAVFALEVEQRRQLFALRSGNDRLDFTEALQLLNLPRAQRDIAIGLHADIDDVADAIDLAQRITAHP